MTGADGRDAPAQPTRVGELLDTRVLDDATEEPGGCVAEADRLLDRLASSCPPGRLKEIIATAARIRAAGGMFGPRVTLGYLRWAARHTSPLTSTRRCPQHCDDGWICSPLKYQTAEGAWVETMQAHPCGVCHPAGHAVWAAGHWCCPQRTAGRRCDICDQATGRGVDVGASAPRGSSGRWDR